MPPAKAKPISAAQLKSLMPALVSSAMDAIVAVDENQRVILFNAAAERMFQCGPEEALGQKLDRFIPEEHRAGHRQHVRNFGQTGQTTRAMGALGTLTALRADGQKFPVEVSISQTEAGGEKIYTAILRDVTASRRAEAELRRREEHFRALIEYAPDLITLVDPEGVIHFQSPAIERVLDLKTDQVTGRNLSEIIHPEDLPRLAAMIRRALANPDAPVSIEFRLRHRDGAWHLFFVRGPQHSTRRGGPADCFQFPRHHRQPQPGGAIVARAKNGGDWDLVGRHRARFQQHAGGHFGQRRTGA